MLFRSCRVTPCGALPQLDPRALAAFRLAEADPKEFADLLDEGLAELSALFTP